MKLFQVTIIDGDNIKNVLMAGKSKWDIEERVEEMDLSDMATNFIKEIPQIDKYKIVLEEYENYYRDKPTKFYHFSQCNSGGSFDFDDDVCTDVIIEAHDSSEANKRAVEIGIYFDGVSKGMDCSCCGDRWDEVDEDDGVSEPMIYDENVYEMSKEIFREKCYIYHLNGRKEVVDFKKKEN